MFNSMKEFLAPLAVGLLSALTMAAASSNPSVLQFRLVADHPTADSEPMTVVQPNNSPRQPEVFNVQKAVLLDQTAVMRATATKDALGQPIVNLEFTQAGARQFAAVTRDNVGKRLAIVIDGKLYSAPRIATEISGGAAEIAGAFTPQQAHDLAARLNGTPVRQPLNAGGLTFHALALLFLAAVAVATTMLVRRKGAPRAA
jgi:preprotein translocase subunit SecD